MRSYSDAIIPSMVTTSESALSVKHSTESWILDSGATSHICCDIDLFDHIAPTSSRIAWGNASTLPARGIGAITVRLPNSARAILESVLYVPELQVNLVSLSRLIQKGAKISFLQGSADILLKSGAKLKATADTQGLFRIPFSVDFQFALVTTKPEKDDLWHQRLAHIGATALNKMPDSVIGMLRSENKITPKNPCEACIKGKFTASPNHDSAETHYTEFGDHISLDLFGPIPINAYKGIKFLFTLLDIVTRWLNFRLLKMKIKSEALESFKEMKMAAENQSGKNIKILRMD